MSRSQVTVYRIVALAGLLFFGVFFLWPLLRVFSLSLHPGASEVSTAYYTKLIGDAFWRGAVVRTLHIALISTALTVFIGYGVAYFIATRRRGQAVWLIVAVAPMLMSLVVRLYGWMILLGQNGPINRLLTAVGWVDAPLDLLFSRTAVIVGIVHYCLPFVVLTVYSVLRRIDLDLGEAAGTLGAGPWRRFATVILPLSVPGLLAGGSLAFALSASTFVVPMMLGGPRDSMMANMAYLAVERMGNQGFGAAIAFFLLLIVVFMLMLANVVSRRWEGGW